MGDETNGCVMSLNMNNNGLYLFLRGMNGSVFLRHG